MPRVHARSNFQSSLTLGGTELRPTTPPTCLHHPWGYRAPARDKPCLQDQDCEQPMHAPPDRQPPLMGSHWVPVAFQINPPLTPIPFFQIASPPARAG